MAEEYEQDNDDIENEQSRSGHGYEDKPQVAEPEEPFSVFTTREKWTLIVMTSYAGFFRSVYVLSCAGAVDQKFRFISATSSSIYFPVIPTLAKDFNTSISLINLTVTSYLIFQGLCKSPRAFRAVLVSSMSTRRPYI